MSRLSSLAPVTLGLLKPSSGRITVDGVPVQTNLRGWQRQLGYVPQTPFFVDDTLRRNIALGVADTEIDEARVLDSVRIAQLEGWVAGCDICQDVCPWNHRPFAGSSDPDLQPRPWWLDLRAGEALEWSDSEWDEKPRASALRRIKPAMWRRNIRAAMAGPPA